MRTLTSSRREVRPASAGADPLRTRVNEVMRMKVRASVKRICNKCKIVRRKGVLRVICENKRHKQRQG